MAHPGGINFTPLEIPEVLSSGLSRFSPCDLWHFLSGDFPRRRAFHPDELNLQRVKHYTGRNAPDRISEGCRVPPTSNYRSKDLSPRTVLVCVCQGRSRTCLAVRFCVGLKLPTEFRTN